MATTNIANVSNRPPCPISPNITPNLKGNIAMQNSPGLTSLYLGIP